MNVKRSSIDKSILPLMQQTNGKSSKYYGLVKNGIDHNNYKETSAYGKENRNVVHYKTYFTKETPTDKLSISNFSVLQSNR